MEGRGKMYSTTYSTSKKNYGAYSGTRATQVATNQGFHIDQTMNGIAVDTWRNQPNHETYTNLIFEKLEALPKNLSPGRAYEELMLIISKAKTAIKNNPNLHLNDLTF